MGSPIPPRTSGGRACEKAGIHLIFGSIAHPQTKGKIERWHRTIREAIEDRVRTAATPEQAQHIIDAYVDQYNHYRPHSSCNGYPPIWRYDRASARKILGQTISSNFHAS